MYANVKITKIIVGFTFLRKPAEAPLELVELDIFICQLFATPRSSLATKPECIHIVQYDTMIVAPLQAMAIIMSEAAFETTAEQK